MMEIKVEVWKDIPGYEGLYQVSNLGRVKSLDKNISCGEGGIRFQQEMILKGNIRNGYLSVSPCIDGIQKPTSIHRLVANVFIPNPEKKKTVNHKNGNKKDNRVINLEWATGTENNLHARRILGVGKQKKGSDNYRSKIVIQLSKDGFFLNSFGSIREAERETNINRYIIKNCISGEFKQAGGFIWK